MNYSFIFTLKYISARIQKCPFFNMNKIHYPLDKQNVTFGKQNVTFGKRSEPLVKQNVTFGKLIQSDITGTLYYPMSGADITPLLICPNASTYVFVDEHNLLDEKSEMESVTKNVTVFNSADKFVDHELVNGIIDKLKNYWEWEGYELFPLSFSMFMEKSARIIKYDFTDPFYILYKGEILSHNSPYLQKYSNELKGIIHFLVPRIRDHTDFDITKFEIIIPRYVYRMTLISRLNGTTKTLIYVKAKFSGDDTGSTVRMTDEVTSRFYRDTGHEVGYKWLISQNFSYTSLIAKGNPYYDCPETEEKIINNIKKNILMVCVDSIKGSNKNVFRIITDQKRCLKQFVDMGSIPIKEINDVKFGYDDYFTVYGSNALNNFISMHCNGNGNDSKKINNENKFHDGKVVYKTSPCHEFRTKTYLQ